MTDGGSPAPHGDRDSLEALRDLLVSPEKARLDQLEQRLGSDPRFTEDVARVLPEAMRRSLDADDRLGRAIAPTIREALQHFIRRDRALFAEILYPVMGPAIRAAIAAALQNMVESFAQVMDRTVSWRSVQWRFDAWRTGRSFGEVALLNSMVYRVEQVFLVHEETGLLIESVGRDGVDLWDADMVSAMLTAVLDYVRDSFGDSDSDLQTVRLGNVTLWVERGAGGILVGVISGTPRAEIRGLFMDAIDDIAARYGPELRRFEGDPSIFEGVRPRLEACLVEQVAPLENGSVRKLRWMTLLMLAVLGAWIFMGVRAEMRRDALRASLEDAPGIVVTRAKAVDGRYEIRGLKDPLAADPGLFVGEAGLGAGDVRLMFAPYVDLSPDFRLRRAVAALRPPSTASLTATDDGLRLTGAVEAEWLERAQILVGALPGSPALDAGSVRVVDADAKTLRAARLHLAPPSSVELSVRGDHLVARGYAPGAWIEAARTRAPLLPGVTALEDAGLEDEVSHRLGRVLERRVEFGVASAALSDAGNAALQSFAEELTALAGAARRAGRTIRLEAVGHASADGDAVVNADLRTARADALLRALRRRGVPADLVVGVGAPQHAPGDESRGATLRIIDPP